MVGEIKFGWVYDDKVPEDIEILVVMDNDLTNIHVAIKETSSWKGLYLKAFDKEGGNTRIVTKGTVICWSHLPRPREDY